MAIVSSSEGAIVFRQTRDEIELSKRRAQFEKNRKKTKSIFSGIQKVDSALITFSNNIQNEINKFKANRNEKNNIQQTK